MGKKFIIRDWKPDDPLPPLFEPGGGAKELMNPDNWVDEPEQNVTAPVTPWEAVGLTEAEWKDLEIPEFLRVEARRTATPPTPTRATVPAAVGSDGGSSGSKPSIATMAGATGNFEQFRVDPEEIEQKIRAEADRLWRNWTPNKTDGNQRPRLSTFQKQVRKGYYP